jgi:hypothetical protein
MKPVIRLPDPPCTPEPPSAPPPVKPAGPGCDTGPDPRKLLRGLLRRDRRR